MAYTISEFAERTGISAYTIRYYEKEGLLSCIERKNGRRVFKDEDFFTINVIIHLKNIGMSIKDIRTYLDLYRQAKDTTEQRQAIILRQKKSLEEKIFSLKNKLQILQSDEMYYQKMIEFN